MRLLFLLCISSMLFAKQSCCNPQALHGRFPCENQIYGFLPTARNCNPFSCYPAYSGPYVTLDFLYWQAKQQGLEFAAQNDQFAPLGTGININAFIIEPNFDWEPAFKLGLGYNFPSSCWDMYLNYTYFRNENTDAASFPINANQNGLIPLWHFVRQPFLAAGIRYANATSLWKLNYNTLDLELGHDAYITSFLSIRLHGGLRGAIIHQDYNVRYTNGNVVAGNQVLFARLRMQNNARLIGPRVGANTQWRLGAGFSFLANGATALTLGQFRTMRAEVDNSLLGGITPAVADVSIEEKIWIWKPMAEISSGFTWGACFGCKSNYYFGLSLAYELQYWWEINLLRHFTDAYVDGMTFFSKGDLILHGVRLQANFAF